ncbi:hypothetical protein AtEden1_Chr2g0226801 [Arabidopsis thaliana]
MKVDALISGPRVSHLKRWKLLFVDLFWGAFFLVFPVVERAFLCCNVISLGLTPAFLALACWSYGFLCVELFALRTTYSHTLKAFVHFVRVDFVCWSLNREVFFGVVDGSPSLVRVVHRPFVLLMPRPLLSSPHPHMFVEHGYNWKLFASNVFVEHLFLEDSSMSIKSMFSCGCSSSLVNTDALLLLYKLRF